MLSSRGGFSCGIMFGGGVGGSAKEGGIDERDFVTFASSDLSCVLFFIFSFFFMGGVIYWWRNRMSFFI